jgi:hypothetical protein
MESFLNLQLVVHIRSYQWGFERFCSQASKRSIRTQPLKYSEKHHLHLNIQPVPRSKHFPFCLLKFYWENNRGLFRDAYKTY